MYLSRGKLNLIEIHPLDRELRSFLYTGYPKNNVSFDSTIDPDMQNNLQRAVNRQPWLPRGRLVETRATQHDRLHDDLNQHDEMIQHPTSQTHDSGETASTTHDLLQMLNRTTT